MLWNDSQPQSLFLSSTASALTAVKLCHTVSHLCLFPRPVPVPVPASLMLRAGYPFRRTFDEFMRTYWQLYPAGRPAPQQSQEAGADACRALLAGCGLSEGADYQIGEAG